MRIWYIAGVIAGILAALGMIALVVVVCRKMKHQRFGKCEFDERQQFARGKAFQAGFLTILIYELLYGVVDLMGVKWCANITGIAIGLFLGIAVFAVVAITKDAYLSMHEEPAGWMAMWGVFILANGVCTAGQILDGKLIQNGMLTEKWMNALCAALFMVILTAQLIHNRKLKREALEE